MLGNPISAVRLWENDERDFTSHVDPWCASRLLRASFSTQNPQLAEKTSYGGLKDEDRIFTNLYCQGDPFIKVNFLSHAWILHCCLAVPLLPGPKDVVTSWGVV